MKKSQTSTLILLFISLFGYMAVYNYWQQMNGQEILLAEHFTKLSSLFSKQPPYTEPTLTTRGFAVYEETVIFILYGLLLLIPLSLTIYHLINKSSGIGYRLAWISLTVFIALGFNTLQSGIWFSL